MSKGDVVLIEADAFSVAFVDALLADDVDRGFAQAEIVLTDLAAREWVEGVTARPHRPCPPIKPSLHERAKAAEEGEQIGRECGKRCWSSERIRARCPWPHPLMKEAFEIGFRAGHASVWKSIN